MHILIVNPFGIGDCLFTTTLIHTLKEEFPHHRLGFLCNKRTAGMFKNNPFLDKIFVYERDDFKRLLSISRQQWLRAFNSFIREIKKERFDLAIDLSLAANFGFFLWLAGIKKRVGYNYKNRGYFLTAEIKLSGYEDKHIVEYYNGLLELLEIKPKYNHLELYLNEKDKRYAEDVFAYQNIGHQNLVIVIAPGGGASWGVDAKLKRWPEENFILLVDKLVEKYKATVIIVGDLNEKDLLINLKTDKNIINLVINHYLFSMTSYYESLCKFRSKKYPLSRMPFWHCSILAFKNILNGFHFTIKIIYTAYVLKNSYAVISYVK